MSYRNFKQRTRIYRRRCPVEYTIEQGSRGATYRSSMDTFTVYRLTVYGSGSVLAGQQCRTWMDDFPSLAEAQAAYPQATLIAGSSYREPSLHHLPDGGDL